MTHCQQFLLGWKKRAMVEPTALMPPGRAARGVVEFDIAKPLVPQQLWIPTLVTWTTTHNPEMWFVLATMMAHIDGARSIITPLLSGITRRPLKYSFPTHHGTSNNTLILLVGIKKPWCSARCTNYQLIVKLLIERGLRTVHYLFTLKKLLSSSFGWLKIRVTQKEVKEQHQGFQRGPPPQY